MKLELSIADDRELRDFIKDLIRGEIVSIARGEIKNIIADVVKEGIIPKDQKTLDDIILKILKEYIEKALGSTWSYTTNDMIKSMLGQEVRKFLLENLTHK